MTAPWVQPADRAENIDQSSRDGSNLLLHGVRLDRSGPAEPREPSATERLDQHTGRVGLRPRGTVELIEAIDRAGLTGHGGAHVPAALKWRAAVATSARESARRAGPLTVVANGAESEPLGGKDATLLRQRPHLVLDGLALTAQALGARRAVVWLHGDDTGTLSAVQAALAERRSASTGHVLAAGDPTGEPWLEVVQGPGHYLAGESSAIGQALDGGAPLPAVRRETGSRHAPRTLVHNVETLARIALVARGHEPVRTTLLTVLTTTGRDVIEVAQGTSAAGVLDRTGWLRNGPPQAVLLGGFGGMWARWLDLEQGTFDEISLRATGLSAGSGIVAPLPQGACGVTETARIAAYLASMSARQCGPCMFGLPALDQSLRLLADGSAPAGERGRLLDDLRAIAGRGACHHPDGAVRLIASALSTFEHDFDEHARGRPCDGSHRQSIPIPQAAA